MRNLPRFGLLPATLLLAGTACTGGSPPFDEAAWGAAEETHREKVEAELTSDGSWLTVAGLHFLTVGEHTVGSGADADLRIPDRFPELAVTVSWTAEGEATARVADGVDAMVGGEPFTEGKLEMGEDGAVILDDRIRFWLHNSGERRALRLRNLDNPLRTNFTGRKWFPLDSRFRVVADFEPYSERRYVEAINIRGDIVDYESDGEAVFDWDGQQIRMQAFNRANGDLFFVFSDGTSGLETYPSARFLEVPAAQDGVVVVDFNRAENPPCGFNAFTTCPTPPPQNRLSIRVEAGELRYHAGSVPTD
jgi:hypothetical protein